MKLNKTRILPLAIGYALVVATAAPMLALAQPASALPHEPTRGSIQVGLLQSDAEQVKLAKLDQAEAIKAAVGHTPGRVVQTELDDENGFLFWVVETVADNGKHTELYVDAGNGEIVAMEQEYDD